MACTVLYFFSWRGRLLLAECRIFLRGGVSKGSVHSEAVGMVTAEGGELYCIGGNSTFPYIFWYRYPVPCIMSGKPLARHPVHA